MISGAHHRFKRLWLVGFACCALAILTMLLWPVTRAEAQDDLARFHFINVGQGDASLLEFPCGAVLIDAGGDAASAPALRAYLDQFFARRSDLNKTFSLVVLTHGHNDHTRNFGDVIGRYRVETLLMNGHFKKKGYKALAGILEPYPDTQLRIADMEQIPNGGLWDAQIDALDCGEPTLPDIRVLWGDARPRLPGWKEKFYKDENNHSVAIMVQWGQGKALFPGDLESRGLRELRERHTDLLRDTQLYKISHHGFRSGTREGFLELLRPEIAVLSRAKERAWYEPTLDRFNKGVTGRRDAIEVPVWNFVEGDSATGADRARPESIASITSAVYWPDVDGHTVVEMDKTGAMRVTFGK